MVEYNRPLIAHMRPLAGILLDLDPYITIFL